MQALMHKIESLIRGKRKRKVPDLRDMQIAELSGRIPYGDTNYKKFRKLDCCWDIEEVDSAPAEADQ